MYGLREQKGIELKDIYSLGSEDLRNFMVEYVRKEDGIEKMEKILEEMYRVEEEQRGEKEMLKVIRFYECQRMVHKSDRCYYKYKGKENKKECNAVYEDDSSVSERSGYRMTAAAKRQKNPSIRELPKRKNETKYRKVFSSGDEVIEYCTIEKCKIKTQEGAKVLKKGQCIPQALIEDTENLEKNEKNNEKNNEKIEKNARNIILIK
ncbi:uncharacterized protein VNE69_10052 [Vairimorpha necatrix]|uniref:Uncharacterized protein n=1 Tax=Vairimorpha necatrix TaxID=6039 RepID=A0AAX4JFY0_9MICR